MFFMPIWAGHAKIGVGLLVSMIEYESVAGAPSSYSQNVAFHSPAESIFLHVDFAQPACPLKRRAYAGTAHYWSSKPWLVDPGT